MLDRDPMSLISTQAGVSSNADDVVINGTRSSFSNVTLDGINIQDNFIRTGGLSLSAEPAADGSGFRIHDLDFEHQRHGRRRIVADHDQHAFGHATSFMARRTGITATTRWRRTTGSTTKTEFPSRF